MSRLPRALVLVGAGHAHVEVLRAFAETPESGVLLQLVVDSPRAVYSGMVPGFVAGRYRAEDVEIDVVRLAERARATVILDAAAGFDLAERVVRTAGGEVVRFDLVSLDVGSTVAGTALPGVAEHAVPTRPIARLVAETDALVARARATAGAGFRLAVVGAGAGGVELAFCFRERLRAEGGVDPEVTLLDAATELLPGAPEALRRRIRRAAASRDIQIRLDAPVAAVEADGLRLADGARIAADGVVWVAGAAAHAFVRQGLPSDAVDPSGFVRVGPTLAVRGCDGVFAAGDCARLEHAPDTPKAGVYAVRQGPVLTRNLRARLRGEPLRAYRPQRDFLSLLNLGDGTAVGAKWGRTFQGAWVMGLKDAIDRRFMRRYR